MSKKLLVILLSVVVFSGCADKFRDHKEATQDLRPVIIFVPGYKGSDLIDANSGKKVWITAWQALFGSKSLIREIPGLEIPEALSLVPGNVLYSVRIVPAVGNVHVYDRWLEFLNESFPEHRIVEFSYDWREDNTQTARKLASLVRNLKSEGVTSVSILAHSMGGLVTAYYLRYGVQNLETAVENWDGAKQIDKVVLAGVPFKGSMKIFRDVVRLYKIGNNSDLLNQQTIASFPSAYQLMQDLNDNELMDENGVFVESIANEQSWLENGWGLFHKVDKSQHEELKIRKHFTKENLARAKNFQELLNAPTKAQESIGGSQLLTIFGNTKETLSGAIRNAKAPGGYVFDPLEFEELNIKLSPDILFEMGDETVTINSATLPKAYHDHFKAKSIASSEKHEDLIVDPEVGKAIREFLE
jgi:pimeloyl-ACP methyl ester carboxylesterase